MKKKIKKVIDIISNKDVKPDDVPGYYYLKTEDLKYGQVEVREDEDVFIQEVFEYNARAVKARIIYKDVEEAKKGYFTVNLVFILAAFIVMKIYDLMDWNNFSVIYGNQAIYIFTAVYLYSRFFKKFNICLNVLSPFLLMIVHWGFGGAVIVNIVLCYIYDRANSRIKDELGYPKFPTVDLILSFRNGQYKKIYAREME